MVATNSKGRAVRLEPETDFVTTGRRLDRPDNLTNQAFEGLLVQVKKIVSCYDARKIKYRIEYRIFNEDTKLSIR